MDFNTLVTDGRSLAALAIIRSLSRKGYTIHCGESFKHNLSSYSKYVDGRVKYPDPEDDPDGFVEYLHAGCEQEGYDLVVPVRDHTTILLSKYRETLSEVTNVFVAPYDVLDPLMDKGETVKIAQRADVPTPDTWFPEETPLEQICDAVEYPVLVRPRRSSGSRGIQYVEDPEEFDEAVDLVSSQYGTPMIQEYIEKCGYTTACVLFDREQRTVGEFSYERVKEYPLSGGPTVVGESTDDREAKTYAKQLLREAGWMGPAEVEFIIDQNGTPRLLEVNPRFWMPVQLAISAGVDFPTLISRLAAGDEPDPVTEYETELTYRWVLPNEILWAMNADSTWDGMRDLVQFDRSSQCYGSLSIRDPKPVLGTVAQSLRFLTDPEKRRFIFDRGW
ncbi:carboxylate--amine ligase [Natrarchaeobius oligotrophus]|uniref:ATP-grasp domain-containing protein n=1 Tax=Natrarchaeobius chitinivorans TaxID=1679083 RepID=A0A3N6M2W8_NATCH|nr:ATP-grasp domain-containing protein [Natrarchaeobius chitinivorans]RQG96177.1 ATP-grasp domain-containing protein [Natrarchaeobius chitinivorans]